MAEDAKWDPAKAAANFQKHGILFPDALSVFWDPANITTRDDHEGEDRWIAVGMDLFARILVVVYTWRGDHIRIISARHATPRERKCYEETL